MSENPKPGEPGDQQERDGDQQQTDKPGDKKPGEGDQQQAA